MMKFLLGSKSIGFLTLNNIVDIGYMGSLLITSFKGIPLEFRCTELIKPDSVQIALYGDTFLSHAGIELSGKPLLNSIENKPRLIFVDKPFLYNISNFSPYPIIFVKINEGSSEIPKNFGLDYKIVEIKSLDGRSKPLQIIKNKEIDSKTKDLVEQLHFDFNILEPFERMKKAVEIIARKNSNSK